MDEKTILTSLLSGFLLGLFLVFYTNYVTLSVSTGFVILIQVVMVVALGVMSGWTLKNTLSDSYPVSIFALLFTYGVSNLVFVTKSIHYFVYVLLVAVIAAAMFYESTKFFSVSTLNRSRKIIIATGIFIVVTVLCAVLGMYISRLIFS